MAHVTLTDGRELDVPDGDPVLAYYRGEGATVEESPTVPQPPYVIVNDEVVKDGESVGTVEELTPFNPADYTVDAVNEYLATADDAERERVLELEAAGDARKGILGDD